MSYVYQWLDRTSMYRVVLYSLLGLIGYAFLLSLVGQLFFTPAQLFFSLLTLFVAGVLTHYAWKEISGAPANIESTLITILILFLLFDPAINVLEYVALALVSALTIVSKYVVAWRKLHLFNPVALGAFVAATTGLAYATWWVSGSLFLVPVIVAGALITQKIRRWGLVLTTIGFGFVSHLAVSFMSGTFLVLELWQYWVAYPMIFFATVMVTEPLTTPAGKRRQLAYGAFIGVLSAIPFSFGPIYASLPLTLLIANAIFYVTTLRGRVMLTLERVETIAERTLAYHFIPVTPLAFTPGQYVEWTLPHRADTRGIRRYFTIASAPNESSVVLGVKVPEQSSTFKQHLAAMRPGDSISVTALHGDFVLPKDPSAQPLVFIAGGIGVTPFRSHVKYLMSQGVPVDATLFFCNRSEEDIAWNDVWEDAATIGLKTIHVLSEPSPAWSGEHGFVTSEMLAKYVTEPHRARYYISGPPGMVDAYRKLLKEMGVPRRSIVTDYFPGLA